MSLFNNENYHSYNTVRWNALDQARLYADWQGKTVLDLGAGDGVFSDTYFTPKGAIVTPVEARDENLAAMYRDRPYFAYRAKKADLEQVFPVGKWDLALCVGLLYHVQTPSMLLANIADVAPVLFLETVIWQTPDSEGIWIVDEPANAYDQAFSGFGCRVSVEWLDHQLKALYPHVYKIAIPHHPSFNGENKGEQRVIRVGSQWAYAHLERV